MDVAKRLVIALHTRGYYDLAWYYLEKGFVVVTRCEAIDDDGDPVSDRRFSCNDERPVHFSVRGIVHAFFRAPEGRFRVIAIVVSARPLPVEAMPRPDAAITVARLSLIGALEPPAELNNVRALGSRIFALFYELKKHGDHQAKILYGDSLPALAHLRGSRLEGLAQ